MTTIKTLLHGLAAATLCMSLVACDEVVVETQAPGGDSNVSVQVDAAPAAAAMTDSASPSCDSGASCATPDLAAEPSCSAATESCETDVDCEEVCPTECEPVECEPDACKPQDKPAKVQD